MRLGSSANTGCRDKKYHLEQAHRQLKEELGLDQLIE